MKYNEIEGNLITLAMNGEFDVISHGCNCFCQMGAGIAPQMAKTFGCDQFPLEQLTKSVFYGGEDGEWVDEPTNYKGDINKLGQIDYKLKYIWLKHPSGSPYAMGHKSVGQKDVLDLIVVNSYTQYHYGKNHIDGVKTPVDYDAITMCMRKINHIFKGKHIGLPYVIGCGLAGGDKNIVLPIIKRELKDMDVTMVNLSL